MKIQPYLMFNGNCREAFEFYHRVLGGTLEAMMPHRGTPAEEHVPEEWRDKIMHACLIVDDQLLMASDSPPQYQKPSGGFSVSLQIDKREDAERIFSELAEGGTVTMPLEKTFWADRFGMLTDRFGTPWMINHAGSTVAPA
jgi:PhnB protein